MDAPLVWTPGEGIRVRAARHAFRTETVELEMEEGVTLAEMAAKAGVPEWATARAWIDDWQIPRLFWDRVRPRAGRRVLFRVVPAGGGGGNDSNKTLRTVLLVVVAVIAIAITIFFPYLAPATIYGVSATYIALGLATIVAVGGALAVNALLPPPKPKLSAMSQPFFGQPSPTYTITGTRNQLAPYQPVPRLYGRHRIFPPLGSFPITATSGGDTQVLQQMFTAGYGPLQLDEFKIGDTLLSTFTGVDLQVREGWPTDPPLTNIGTVRFEEPLQITLNNAEYHSHAGRQDADWLSIDVTFPQGLFYVPDWDPQHWHNLTTNIDVWHRELNPDGTPAGTGAWIYDYRWLFNEGRRETLRFTREIYPGRRGYWEVLLQKLNPVPPPENWSEQAIWTALRSFRAEDPMPVPGMAKMGLAIQASGQLTGVVDQFNFVATSYLREWIGGAWQVVPSRNPAAVFLDILQGSANARPVPNAEIDFPTLIDWMEECRTRGYTFDAVFDTQTTVYEALQNVAAVGRASFTMRDGKYSVTRDRAQTVPVQFFTPRNSWGLSGMKTYTDIPHALKVKFINPEANWQLDERMVFDDGYTEVTATKFEGLELFGVTNPDLAWKHGRYWLAAARLRPETWTLNTDVEYLVANRGDLVHVNHDVPLWGLAAARILALTPVGGGVEVVIDELLDQFAVGTLLALRVRQRDGGSYVGPVTLTPDPDNRVSRLASTAPIPEAHVGDLVMLGTWGEDTVACVIKQIEPGQDLSAKLTLVDAAPAILQADTGPIPPFDSHITRPPPFHFTIPAPEIITVRSDETVMATLTPRIVVTFTVPTTTSLYPPTHVEGQYRPTGSAAAWAAMPLVPLPAGQMVFEPVVTGTDYDVRLRTHNLTRSLVSDWTTVPAHRVAGVTGAPPDPLSLTLDQGDLELRWLYPIIPVDFAGFQVRAAQGVVETWENTQPLHDALVSDTRFHLPPLSGLHTLMVKALDVGGRESVLPAILVAELLAEPGNLLDEVDLGVASFPGTREGLTQETGPPVQLCPIAVDDPLVWSTPAKLVWGPVGTALQWAATTGPGVYTTSLTVPPLHDGTTLTWAWQTTGPGWLLEYRAGGDTPVWTTGTALVWHGAGTTLVWSALTAPWLAWPGALDVHAGDYGFRWRFLGGPAACLYDAVAGFEVPDIDEFIDNFAVPIGGTRLPISLTYRVIRTVLLSVEAAGTTVIVPSVLDKNPTLGPLIELRNAQNGQSIAGIVDAHIRGY